MYSIMYVLKNEAVQKISFDLIQINPVRRFKVRDIYKYKRV